MPPALQASRNACARCGDLVVVLAEGEALHRAGLLDDAGPRDRRRRYRRRRRADASRPTIGAIMSSFCTPFWSEMMPVSGPITGRICFAARLGVAQLHREDHHVDRADGGGVIGRLHVGQMERLWSPSTARPFRLHGFQVFATRNERDIGAAMLQQRAVVAADAARTHDRDFHACSPELCRAERSHLRHARRGGLRRIARLLSRRVLR